MSMANAARSSSSRHRLAATLSRNPGAPMSDTLSRMAVTARVARPGIWFAGSARTARGWLQWMCSPTPRSRPAESGPPWSRPRRSLSRRRQAGQWGHPFLRVLGVGVVAAPLGGPVAHQLTGPGLASPGSSRRLPVRSALDKNPLSSTRAGLCPRRRPTSRPLLWLQSGLLRGRGRSACPAPRSGRPRPGREGPGPGPEDYRTWWYQRSRVFPSCPCSPRIRRSTAPGHRRRRSRRTRHRRPSPTSPDSATSPSAPRPRVHPRSRAHRPVPTPPRSRPVRPRLAAARPSGHRCL